MLRLLQSCVISFNETFVPWLVKNLWGVPCLNTILSKIIWVMTAILIEDKDAVSTYFVKRLPTIRIYQFPKFVTWRGPIQSATITFQEAQQHMKFCYDQHAKDHPFRLGQKVWIYNPSVKQGLLKKLWSLWHIPFCLVDQATPVSFKKLPIFKESYKKAQYT